MGLQKSEKMGTITLGHITPSLRNAITILSSSVGIPSSPRARTGRVLLFPSTYFRAQNWYIRRPESGEREEESFSGRSR